MTDSDTPGLPDNYTLIPLDSIDSTNAEAVRHASTVPAGETNNIVIWAHEQTGGRGRRGRTWVSPQGNLYCSILVRPKCPISHAAQTGYVAALAVYDLMRFYCPEMCAIETKWPNDLLINGKKASGILLESSSTTDGNVHWLVVGIGVNIRSFPENTPYAATSLNNERDRPVTVADALMRLMTAYEYWYQMWLAEGFSAIREHWIGKARGIGEEIIVRLDKKELSGIFAGIDHNGALILRKDTGDQHISAGEVFFPNLS